MLGQPKQTQQLADIASAPYLPADLSTNSSTSTNKPGTGTNSNAKDAAVAAPDQLTALLLVSRSLQRHVPLCTDLDNLYRKALKLAPLQPPAAAGEGVGADGGGEGESARGVRARRGRGHKEQEQEPQDEQAQQPQDQDQDQQHQEAQDLDQEAQLDTQASGMDPWEAEQVADDPHAMMDLDPAGPDPYLDPEDVAVARHHEGGGELGGLYCFQLVLLPGLYCLL